MCGIAAIIDPQANSATATAALDDAVARMLDRIRHRGDEDRFGERWTDAGVALGANRLAITDREHAYQPMTDAEEHVRVVYNGELYGYELLRSELTARGHRFRTDADTEVLVHAYLEWGASFVSRLNGMFAVVLYDTRSRTFIAARDHIGIKPLYTCVRDGAHYFASERKCLLDVGAPVREVAPGTVTENGIARQYFELPDAEVAMSDDVAVRRFRQLFDDAVHRQVNTDLPVAVMFSGGIDSTALLYTARQHHPAVTAFTIGFRESADVVVASRYCAENDIPHIVGLLDKKSLIEAIPAVVYGSEFFESIDVMDTCVSYRAYELVKAHGLKVALCGEGSDEVLAGYDLFKQHPDPLDLLRYRVHNLYRTDLQRVDRASMMHTVETRVPFLDREFLDFAYPLPMSLKIRGNVEKWILREAFRDSLPSYIADRPKIRMPDGSGMKNTLANYASRPVDLDGGAVDRLGIDSPQGAFFLNEYLKAGFPMPEKRARKAAYDYSANGYFEFVS